MDIIRLSVRCLLLGVWALVVPASGQSIGVFADPGGVDCTIDCSALSPCTFYVVAKLGGSAAGGLTGAEFQVVGIPAGWTANAVPNPAATIVLDDPLTGGANIVFSSCQTGVGGSVLLYTITAVATTSLSDVQLQVMPHSTPSNANFVCPLVTLCDVPAFTIVCVTGLTSVINDTSAPQVTCPEEIVVRCTSPEGAPVADVPIEGSATDFCDTELPVSDNRPDDFYPPSCSGDRPTIVTFTATNDSGFEGTCQSRVYVFGPMCCPGFVDGELTLLPADVDLRQETNGPTITKGNFDIWNQDEVRFSGTHRCVNCWDQELLSLYGSPNHFLRGLIHSDKGKARVDGLQSQVCPGSVESPMVGVFLKEISFLGRISDVLRSAITPVGTGSESAQIRWDIIAPQNALSQNVKTSKRQNVEMPEPIGKGQSEVGDSGSVAGINPGGRGDITRKGSLLMWPRVEVRWNAAGELIEDTILDLSNDFTQAMNVQLYLVNGDAPLEAECLPNCAGIPNCLDFAYCVERAHPGWNKSDVQLTLTANQPTYWSAATGQPAGVSPFDILDPGDRPGRPDLDPRNPGGRVIRGFVLGWAVSPEGHEICWNHLVGDALLIHYQDSSAAEYNAWAFQCVADVEPGAEPDGFPGQLNLDGMEYEFVPDALIFDFYSVGSSALSHPSVRGPRRP